MEDKLVRIILDQLRIGIKNKDWNKVKYVEGLLNMHTTDYVLKSNDEKLIFDYLAKKTADYLTVILADVDFTGKTQKECEKIFNEKMKQKKVD